MRRGWVNSESICDINEFMMTDLWVIDKSICELLCRIDEFLVSAYLTYCLVLLTLISACIFFKYGSQYLCDMRKL